MSSHSTTANHQTINSKTWHKLTCKAGDRSIDLRHHQYAAATIGNIQSFEAHYCVQDSRSNQDTNAPMDLGAQRTHETFPTHFADGGNCSRGVICPSCCSCSKPPVPNGLPRLPKQHRPNSAPSPISNLLDNPPLTAISSSACSGSVGGCDSCKASRLRLMHN